MKRKNYLIEIKCSPHFNLIKFREVVLNVIEGKCLDIR